MISSYRILSFVNSAIFFNSSKNIKRENLLGITRKSFISIYVMIKILFLEKKIFNYHYCLLLYSHFTTEIWNTDFYWIFSFCIFDILHTFSSLQSHFFKSASILFPESEKAQFCVTWSNTLFFYHMKSFMWYAALKYINIYFFSYSEIEKYKDMHHYIERKSNMHVSYDIFICAIFKFNGNFIHSNI